MSGYGYQGYRGGRGQKRYYDDRGGRGGGRGGGGGYGGGGDYKRQRYSNDRQGPNRGPPTKPKTKEDEIRSQIKALLVRVGDFHHISSSYSSLEENIEGLAGALGDELASFGDFVIEFILTAIAQLSMQTPVYATLVGLLNARDEDFGNKVVRGAATRLGDMIHRGRWINAKLILRFLAELVNARVVKADGEGSLGELLMLLLAPVKEDTVPAARKDLYLYLVVSVLPWVWDALSKEWPDGLPALLETALAYAEQRTPLYRKNGLRCVLEAGLNEDGEEDEPVQDSIEKAVAIVKELADTLESGKSGSIEINAIVKPWRSVKEELAQGIRHGIPLLVVPDPDPRPDQPLVQDLPFHPCFAEFDIFDEESGEKVATAVQLPAVERWVLREYIKDNLLTFRPFVTEGGNKRGSFVSETDQLLSISYLAPPDVSTEFLVVEYLLLGLLQLPIRDRAYLHRLLVQVVQIPKAASALALAVHILFQDFLEVMDHVAVVHLADWFGTHLANTQFAFPYWETWEALIAEHGNSADADHAQLFFLRHALDVATRLTFVSKVKESIPSSFHSLVPGQPYTHSPYLPPEAPEIAVEGDSAMTLLLKELVVKFKVILQGSVTPEEVQAWLDSPHPQMDAEIGDSDPLWRITLIAHAISRISDNTVAHLPALLEKCLNWFRLMFESDEYQLRMIEALVEVWSNSPQMLLLALNAVMRMHIVLPVNVVTYLVRPEVGQAYARSALYWHLFSDALDRSIESVANYVEIIARATGHGSNIRAIVGLDEDKAKQVAGADALEHGSVAVENAQDVAVETVEGLMKTLNNALVTQRKGKKKANDEIQEWIRAGLAYFRSVLHKYRLLEESGMNRAMPGSDPIFDLDKILEESDSTSNLAPALQNILDDSQRYTQEKQFFGGEQAHSQIFSLED